MDDRICPLRGHPAETRPDGPVHNRMSVECSICGPYLISRMLWDTIPLQDTEVPRRYAAAAYVRECADQGSSPDLLTWELYETLADRFPPLVHEEKVERLLEFMAADTPAPGAPIISGQLPLYAVRLRVSDEEIESLRRFLSSSGFLSLVQDGDFLTPEGWKLIWQKGKADGEIGTALRDQVLEQISSVNAQSRRILGFSLFVTSEYRVFPDLGRAPSDRDELNSCIQALGILLSQVNNKKLTDALRKQERKVPPGSMNRIEKVLMLKGIDANQSISRLRDIGRLRSLYPAHPNHPDIVAAAERLGFPLDVKSPLKTWDRILGTVRDSLKELAEALSGDV